MTQDTSSRWLIGLVAAPFLVGGGLAAVAAFGAPANSKASLLLGLLNVFVGLGLLFRRPAWRAAALVLLALQLSGTIFIGALLVTAGSPLTLELLNRVVQLDRGLGALLLVVLASVEVVSLVILSQPSVRGSFASHT